MLLPRCFAHGAAALLLVLFFVSPEGSAQSFSGVLTQHNDNGRTGQNLQEIILTPQNVNSATFGKLYSYSVDGQVYAQPLYVPNVSVPNQGVHNVVYVATENDSVYAFDADGLQNTPLWQDSFINPAAGITPVPCGSVGNTDISCAVWPYYGITGTPVIDLSNDTMYVVVRTYEKSAGVQRLHALDITTGAEKFGGPIVIAASVSGTGLGHTKGNIISFDSSHDNQRAGLLLLNGIVYIGWAGAYHGWIMGYSAQNATQTLTQVAVLNTTPNASLGGVWASGNGLAADSFGNIYAAVGDAAFDASTGGSDYGDSVIKLNGSLQVLDYFAPMEQACRATYDKDLGSAGPMVLPTQPGSFPDELVTAGKGGKPCDASGFSSIYLLNQDSLGGFNASQDQVIEEVQGSTGGYWSSPAYWQGPAGSYVYSAGTGGGQITGDYLKMFSLTNGQLSATPIAQSSNPFTVGATPSVSANGTANGIVWAIKRQDPLGTLSGIKPAILYAYDATNVKSMLYNSAQQPLRDLGGCGNKFQVPTIANGKVYVGTQNEIDIFGLLPLNPPPAPAVSLSSPCESFPTQAVGVTSNPLSVVLTNSGNSSATPLAISSVAITGTNAADFAQTNNCASLNSGANCTISITFTPSLAQAESAYVTIVDNAPGSPHNIYLFATGQLPTILTWPTPAPITYGTALGPSQLNATANIAGTFVYSPAAGAQLSAGSQTLSVTFTPTNLTLYQVATKTVSLQVNPASTAVTWATPAPILYGSGLTALQLDATANVPGSFAYSPNFGAVLNVGAQNMSVAFTPTDSIDYLSSNASTTLQVTPAGLTVTANPASGVYGQPLPLFSFTVSGFVNGDTQNSAITGVPGEATTASSTSPPGLYPVVISQGSLASANYNFSSFVNGTLTIQQAPSSLIVAASPSTVSFGQSTTLTATVSVTGSGAAPTQNVTFMLGTTVLGTASLSAMDATDSSATVTLNATQLALGGNSITAVYSGDTNYAASTSPAITVTAVNSPGIFGSVNVGTAAQAQRVTYNFTSTQTLKSVSVLTAGISGLDYSDAGGSTCIAGSTYNAGQSCTVNVAFTPSAPGDRRGAVTLFAQGSTLPLTTLYLSGVGQSAAITIDPGTQSTIAALNNNGQGYSSVIDGAGNLFVLDNTNSQVVEIAAGTFAQTPVVSSGLSSPTGIALDGAGNLYLSDTGNSRVVLVPNEQGALNPADISTVAITGLVSPGGLATDGRGNLYVADVASGSVIEVSAGGGTQISLASGLTSLQELAVDAPGNVYITENNEVAEYALSGGSPILLGSGYLNPGSIAVDASGAVYVADSGNSRIARVAGGGSSQQTIALAGITQPRSVTLDAAGNLYITAGNLIYELNRGQATPLVFGNTGVGLNSPSQTEAISNAGNQALTVSNLATSQNFVQVASGGTDCNSSSQLAPNAQCSVAIEFAPTTSGPLSGTLTIVDNALNNPASVQTVQLSGSAAQSSQTITFPTIPTQTYGTAPVLLSATASSGLPITYIVVAGPANVSGNLLTITGAGTITVQATQAGNSGYAAATPLSQSFNVNPASTTVTWASPASITYGTGLSASQLNATASVPGTFVYSPTAGTVLNAGSQTLTVTFTPTDSVDYSASAGSVTLQVSPATQTITVTQGAPSSAPYNSTFTLSASASSGLPVTFGSSGSCTNVGAIFTMTKSTGTCTATVTQAGNTNYMPSSPVSQSTSATKATPSVTFTGAPATAFYLATFTVVATTNDGATVTLSSTGVCSISGTTVSMTSGTGKCTLTAKWPATSLYLSASATQVVTAAKLLPVVSWASPAPIVYGTALSGTQLNATASTSGSFVYSPVAGTILAAGSRTLSVNFTPTLTQNYTNNTAKVTLTVNKTATTTAITSSTPNPSAAGQAVQVQFSVTPASGYGSPTGRVTVTATTGETCNATLASSAGSCSITFKTSGVRTLTASYPGDSNDISSGSVAVTQTVN